jgi:SAM-dependent methyltransferase
MTEFTGERVIPGQVDDNLFNEHLARYRFALRLVRGWGIHGAILDAGCGAGYGSAELAKSGAPVLGIDIAEEAMIEARGRYPGGNPRFEQASCTAIPGDDDAFHLITAFEVIEHLEDWRAFLVEMRRVIAPAGLFLVSTPNRLYYAESRRQAGPNPFHVHEFTGEEFRAELAAVFPHVKVLEQNHVEGIAFSGADAEGSALEIGERDSDPASAHFFLALCGRKPLAPVSRFVFIPDAGNVLQTRERHIALLDGEIRQKNDWIAAEKAERARMMEKVRDLEAELEAHNTWAQQANAEAERRAALVAELQAELRKSNEWAQKRDEEAVERGRRIEELQAEVAKATAWAHTRDAEAVERGQRVEELQSEVTKATVWAKERDAEAVERGLRVEQLQEEVNRATDWARSLDAEARERGQRIEELQTEVTKATQWAQRVDAESVVLQDTIKAMQAESAATNASYEAAIAQWRHDKELSDSWAIETEKRLSAERDAARKALAEREEELAGAIRRVAAIKAEMEELRGEAIESATRLEMVAQSRWVRLGRKFRVGPEIHRA